MNEELVEEITRLQVENEQLRRERDEAQMERSDAEREVEKVERELEDAYITIRTLVLVRDDEGGQE